MTDKIEPVEGKIKSKSTRAPRRSLHNEGKMKVPSIPGYYTRFINTDERSHPTRLQDAKAAWYEPVLRKEIYGEDCENPDDIVRVNDPMSPMLVKLPMEEREKDLAAKVDANNQAVKEASKSKNKNEYGQVTVS